MTVTKSIPYPQYLRYDPVNPAESGGMGDGDYPAPLPGVLRQVTVQPSSRTGRWAHVNGYQNVPDRAPYLGRDGRWYTARGGYAFQWEQESAVGPISTGAKHMYQHFSSGVSGLPFHAIGVGAGCAPATIAAANALLTARNVGCPVDPAVVTAFETAYIND